MREATREGSQLWPWRLRLSPKSLLFSDLRLVLGAAAVFLFLHGASESFCIGRTRLLTSTVIHTHYMAEVTELVFVYGF